MNANEIMKVLEKKELLTSRAVLGAEMADVQIPMKVFNGSCLKRNDEAAIYLVMDGKKCHIPNVPTLLNLYKDGSHVLSGGTLGRILEFVIPKMENGAEISDGALLIKSDSSDAVFLLTNNRKYGITSMEQFNSCHFDAEKIRIFPNVIIEAIPNGDNCSFDSTID